MGRRHFKALQRMLRREGRESKHDPEHSRVHSYDGQAHHRRTARRDDKMHARVCLLQSQVCLLPVSQAESSLVMKNHQPPPFSPSCQLHWQAQTWECPTLAAPASPEQG